MTIDADLSKWGELGDMVTLPLNYSHAPIAEAIIEFVTEPCESLDMVALEDLLGSEDHYSDPEPAMSFKGEVSVVEAEVIGGVKGTKVGYVYRREDGKRVIQAHRDRFIFSWLPPYLHWDEFVDEAMSYWRRYVAIAHPEQLVRIGVRFVNRIELPNRSVELKDYIRVSVDQPAYLPQAIRQMFAQLQFDLVAFSAVGTITALLQPPDEERAHIVLDIDIRKTVELKLDDDHFDEVLADELQESRDAKNFVFEACITDATRGLIQ
ncbi:TIGR04255 family protein [Arthrobacter sp. TB 23]|uniref:TIGR04255 family protein n=1 Tax=Arthrobacter sp. TB 23 TaxID=494419 RepID=UPI00036A47AB|nr:TIGR04255 family protein [Arthrobacter sp. TB 23]